MTRNTLRATVETDAKSSFDQLECRVQGRLSGRVRHFRLFHHDCGIVLRGFAPSYYAKQLAQHAVMTETHLPIFANEIVVS